MSGAAEEGELERAAALQHLACAVKSLSFHQAVKLEGWRGS
jgi:hypothetical protein